MKSGRVGYGFRTARNLSARNLAAMGLSLVLAACQTSLQNTSLPAPETPAAATLAFDGFVGVPKNAGDEVISALVSAGADRRFAIVQAGDPRAGYVLRGYLAPQAEGGTTAINYVWDVFDRSGNRLQRLVGETRLPAAVADGWTLVHGSGARDIAEASAVDIARFLAGNRSPTLASGSLVAPTPADTNLPAAPIPAALVPATATTPQSPGPAHDVPAGAPARQAQSRSISVGDVRGVEGQVATSLKTAAEKALGEVGYKVVAPGAPSDVKLSGEATINPGPGGRRLAALVWLVADARGRELGEVRQLARLGAAGVEAHAAMTKAIDGLLPGVVALAPPQP